MREIYLCCIAKNEDFYIAEWIDYHLKIGFDKIVIYANDWIYNNDNPNVIVINISGWGVQMPAYNHFLSYFKNKFLWVAFWDVDEFIVLNKHKDIKSLLDDYDDLTCVTINWALFGSNNHKKVIDNNYNVIERFTKRSKNIPYIPGYENKKDFHLNRPVKSIVRYNHIGKMFVHEPEGVLHTLNRQPMIGPFNDDVDYSIAQLNHYFIKSDEENDKRLLVGVPDLGRFKDKQFYTIRDEHCNEVDDFKALEFMKVLR